MDRIIERFDRILRSGDATPTAAIRLEMQRTMREDAAVFRTGSFLQRRLERMKAANASWRDVRVSDQNLVWNTDLLEILELENLVQ